MTTKQVLSAIQEINKQRFENPEEFRLEIIQLFAEALGYSLENLQFDMTLPQDDGVIQPDAVIAADLESKPYLGIEVELYPRDEQYIETDRSNIKNDEYGRRQHSFNKATEFFEAGVERVLIITNSHLYFSSGVAESNNEEAQGSKRSGHIEIGPEISQNSIETLVEALGAPSEIPQEPLDWGSPDEVKIDDTYFTLDIDEFLQRRKSVENEGDSNDKGDKFENLSEYMLNGFSCVSVIRKNVYNSIGEIDRVAEYTGSEGNPFFENHDRLIIVECKSSDDSIGSGEVRKFGDKIKTAGSSLGILFAKGGISGDEDGRYARRAIRNLYQRENIIMAVINNNDLDRISS
ncbi:hypothetical protein, partial [Halorubrum ezzemoulense]